MDRPNPVVDPVTWDTSRDEASALQGGLGDYSGLLEHAQDSWGLSITAPGGSGLWCHFSVRAQVGNHPDRPYIIPTGMV